MNKRQILLTNVYLCILLLRFALLTVKLAHGCIKTIGYVSMCLCCYRPPTAIFITAWSSWYDKLLAINFGSVSAEKKDK